MSKTTQTRLQVWHFPAAASATKLTSAHALDGSTLTTFSNQPDFARTLALVASGATTGNVVINGTDILDQTITETIALNGTTPVDTLNAFKTVTSIVLPTVAATTINIGTTANLGLDSYCDNYSFPGLPGVTSYTSDASVISKNTVLFSGSLNGATDFSTAYYPLEFPTYERTWG